MNAIFRILSGEIKEIDSKIQRKTDGRRHQPEKAAGSCWTAFPAPGVKSIPVMLSFFREKRFGNPRQATYAELDLRMRT
ncbi:MAG: hypothetical protein ACTFAK_12345 [Candidatus Electronema sp. VV]